MIHAKDVMIGDWVILYGSLTRWGYTDYAKWHNEMERTDIHAVEPVRITPEILEKNGFIRLSDTMYYIQNVNLIVEIRLWEQIKIRIGEKYNSALRVGYDWFINGLTITYIHELQHALRLCGIEKEIEL